MSEMSVLLVPDVPGSARAHLARRLADHGAVVGPSRPWLGARESLDRAVRAVRIAGAPGPGTVLDTEDHLVPLIVTADAQALADLRARVLAPLADEREATAAKLIETLRSWLLHQGRREEIAAELFVHPQTVRYRVARLRELYGERLRDPDWLLSLTIALAVPAPR
jgi:DNA-binding PucR family transcriptional regulator